MANLQQDYGYVVDEQQSVAEVDGVGHQRLVVARFCTVYDRFGDAFGDLHNVEEPVRERWNDDQEQRNRPEQEDPRHDGAGLAKEERPQPDPEQDLTSRQGDNQA